VHTVHIEGEGESAAVLVEPAPLSVH